MFINVAVRTASATSSSPSSRSGSHLRLQLEPAQPRRARGSGPACSRRHRTGPPVHHRQRPSQRRRSTGPRRTPSSPTCCCACRAPCPCRRRSSPSRSRAPAGPRGRGDWRAAISLTYGQGPRRPRSGPRVGRSRARAGHRRGRRAPPRRRSRRDPARLRLRRDAPPRPAAQLGRAVHHAIRWAAPASPPAWASTAPPSSPPCCTTRWRTPPPRWPTSRPRFGAGGRAAGGRGHQALEDPLREPGGAPGRELPQADRLDVERHPGAGHQARRPPAQHAHAAPT